LGIAQEGDTFSSLAKRLNILTKLIGSLSVQSPQTDSMSALPRMLEFKILIYQESENNRPPVYVAHCLNYDLVAEGDTVSDVLNSLQRIIIMQIDVSLDNGIEPFSDFDPAPPELWAQYRTLIREDKAFAFETLAKTSETDSAKRPFHGVALMKWAA
jgi:hypothetical protein